MTATTDLQCHVVGASARSGDRPTTVFGALDRASGVLLIDLSRELKPGMVEVRRRGASFVTNDAAVADFDQLFTEADLKDAIDAYFYFNSRGVLELESAVQRFNPETKIEADGMDEGGRKYRIAPDISNGQLGVIVMCWFARRIGGFDRVLDAYDDFADMESFTVGAGPLTDDQGRTISRMEMGGKLPIGADGWPLE